MQHGGSESKGDLSDGVYAQAGLPQSSAQVGLPRREGSAAARRRSSSSTVR